MKNKLIPVFVIASILLVSCSDLSKKSAEEIVQPSTSQNTSPVTGNIPSLKLINTDGNPLNLANLKGKKVFINLWATWCPPCRAELPSIEKLYARIDKKNTEFVMLSLDEDFGTAKAFAKANKMNLPVYYLDENLPAMFNTGGIPATFVFNEKGELIKMNTGMDNYDTEEYIQLLKAEN